MAPAGWRNKLSAPKEAQQQQSEERKCLLRFEAVAVERHRGTVTVRQSGGAEIVTIPKSVGRALGLHVGSELVLSVIDGRIVLDPAPDDTPSLEDLLAGSAPEDLSLIEEDLEWLTMKPVGKEL